MQYKLMNKSPIFVPFMVVGSKTTVNEITGKTTCLYTSILGYTYIYCQLVINT